MPVVGEPTLYKPGAVPLLAALDREQMVFNVGFAPAKVIRTAIA